MDEKNTNEVLPLTMEDFKTLTDDIQKKAMESVEVKATEITKKAFESFKADLASKNTPSALITPNIMLKAPDNRLGTFLHAVAFKHFNPEIKTIEESFTKLGKDIGMYMSTDYAVKALNMGVGAEGGFTVQEDFATEIVPLLTNATVVRKAGCPIEMLPKGNRTIPIAKAGTTAYMTGEAKEMTYSDMEFGQINLNVHELCAGLAISDILLRYQSYSLPQTIQTNLVINISILEDTQYLIGSGVGNNCKGIIGWVPTTSQLTMTGTPTNLTKLTDMTNLIASLSNANVMMVKPIIFMSNAMRMNLATQVTTLGTPMWYAQELNTITATAPQGSIFGVPVYVTNSLAGKGYIICADLFYCVIGMGADIRMKFIEGGDYLNSAGNVVHGRITHESVFEVLMDVDFAVKQPYAVSYLSGITWGNIS